MKFYNNIDLNGNQVQNQVMEVLGSDPGSPVEGRHWYNSTGHVLKFKDNSVVRTLATTANSLSDFAVPTGSVSWNSQKITNLLDPTSAQDAATKNYVDLTAQGLSQKPSARAATTTTLPTNTYANGTSGVGATLTGNSNAALGTIDGVTLLVGDLLLVKNEATTANNGLYTVTNLGNGTSQGYILTRHADMDQTGEFSGGFIAVETGGTANGNTLWLTNITGSVTVGTTSIGFTQLNAATTYSQGTGITISSNTISINTSYVGQTSITTLGTITTGTWTGTAIAVLNGGTGQTTAVNARGTSGLGSKTASANATNVAPSDVGIPLCVTAVITADGSATSFTVTHNIGRQFVAVAIYDNASPPNKLMADVQLTSSNACAIVFATAPANTTVFNVVVHG